MSQQAPKGEVQSMAHEEVFHTPKELHGFPIYTDRNLGTMCGNDGEGYGMVVKGT